ncbi:MAG: glucokinase [Desulfovibrionales bacterium]
MLIMSADIGGTTSRIAWFKADPEGDITLEHKIERKTDGLESFPDLLEHLNTEKRVPSLGNCDAAVFAVAGAVQRKVFSRPPNISWEINLQEVQPHLDAPMALINDFEAQAYGCLTRAIEQSLMVKGGEPEHDQALAIIGAGTGLGHCALIQVDNRYETIPSEMGHAMFGFAGDREDGFKNFVLNRTGKPYVYAELVVSGRGLSFVHDFLTGDTLEPAEVAALLHEKSETLEWFARFYGRACRQYALAVVPLAGMFITGGVAAKNPIIVNHPAFCQEFLNSPTQRHLLEQIPLHLNRDEDLGLWGGAYKGMHLLGYKPKRFFPATMAS